MTSYLRTVVPEDVSTVAVSDVIASSCAGHANAPAASYWLRRVQRTVGADTRRVRCARTAGGGVCKVK